MSVTYKVTSYLLVVLACLFSIFQIWEGISADLGSVIFRPTHLTWVIILVFLHSPLSSSNHKGKLLLDFLFICATFITGLNIIIFDYIDISYLIYGLNNLDLWSGIIFIGLLLEATRRTVGIAMVIIVAVFISYSLFGNYLSGAIATKVFTYSEFIQFQIFSSNGVFGAPLGIAATTVFVFILFGAMLEVTGAGRFFIDLSFAIAGKSKGAPAKASVIASATLGSISGSAIANAVTTGTLTIPMMKKLGYSPAQAAGVEAAASTGGQIMPPIMGAGAFVMAQFTGIAYKEILIVSFVPAVLYFFSTLLYVHIIAIKRGVEVLHSDQKIRTLILQSWHILLSLLFLVLLLLFGYTPVIVGIIGTLSLLIISLLRRSTRINLRQFFLGLKNSAIGCLPISVACASSGVIVGVVGQTGIGLQFTHSIIGLSGGSLFIVFILVSFASVILGMGLPVTAAYIVLAVMAVPVLMDFSIPLLSAHLIIFWLSQTSNITPPIALAAFAAAGVAKASPFKSAIEALKLGSGLFVIPLMMAYTGLIYTNDNTIFDLIVAVFLTLGMILALAIIVEGFVFAPFTLFMRSVMIPTIMAILFGTFSIQIMGIVLVFFVIFFNYIKSFPKLSSVN